MHWSQIERRPQEDAPVSQISEARFLQTGQKWRQRFSIDVWIDKMSECAPTQSQIGDTRNEDCGVYRKLLAQDLAQYRMPSQRVSGVYPVEEEENQWERHRRLFGACAEEKTRRHQHGARKVMPDHSIEQQSEQDEASQQQFRLTADPGNRFHECRVQA